MNRIFLRTTVLAGFFMGGLTYSFGSALQVNGICELGSCSSPDVLGITTGVNSSPFDFNYQFANSDLYRLQGNEESFNYSNLFGVGVADFVVTYLGNATGTASGNDVLANDFIQKYAFRPASTTTYEASLYGTFGPNLGSATSVSAIFKDRSQVVGNLGPISPPPGDFNVSTSGQTFSAAGDPTLDYQYTLIFGEGSQVGSSITLYPSSPTSPVPEPGTLSLFGSGLLGVIQLIRRGRSR